jgi:hypothetical protein
MSQLRIPVRCDEAVHHIEIDPLKLEAYLLDHQITMERYACLEEIGGDPPMCYKMCKAFNDISAPFRNTPQKFWEFVTELSDFARKKHEDIL